jgi:hypothetical protein
MTFIKTKTIQGARITLDGGERYVASRPFWSKGQRLTDISIKKTTAPLDSPALAVVRGLTYGQADKFLAAFNNGAFSWEGRVW